MNNNVNKYTYTCTCLVNEIIYTNYQDQQLWSLMVIQCKTISSTKKKTKKRSCVANCENWKKQLQDCLFPCGLQCHEVSHANVIFTRIATTADRHASAPGFISKAARGKCIPARLSLEQYRFKFYTGTGTSVKIAEINHERAFREWLIGLLWSVNHFITLGVTRAFFSRIGHHILATCFSMTGGSVMVPQFYFPVTEFPHLLATRIRERGASFWR